MEFSIWYLFILAPIAFIQNAVFTLVSRSRASADIRRHAKAAVLSNGIYMITQVFVWGGFWSLFNGGSWQNMLAMAAVYTVSTASGSCFMMAANLGRFENVRGLSWIHRHLVEKGKEQVGARLSIRST